MIRGGTVVLPDGRQQADISIEGGRITAIAAELDHAQQEIDAIVAKRCGNHRQRSADFQ